MTTVLKINVAEMDSRFVEGLKKAHAKSDLEIHVMGASGDASPLTEDGFWSIINQLNWEATGDDEKVLAPAVQFLSKKSLSHIYKFVDLLSEKLFDLDTKEHAQVFMEEDEGVLSVDDFLYARCAVVANGKKAFLSILKKPAKMPTDVTFEPLLHLADLAYKLKTGKEAVLKPTLSYETYSNKNGWGLT